MSRIFTDEDRRKAMEAKKRNAILRAEGKLPPIKRPVRRAPLDGTATVGDPTDQAIPLDHPMFAAPEAKPRTKKEKKDTAAADLLSLIVALARRSGML